MPFGWVQSSTVQSIPAATVPATQVVNFTTQASVAGNRYRLLMQIENVGADPLISSISDVQSNTWARDKSISWADGSGINGRIEVWSTSGSTTALATTDNITVNFTWDAGATQGWTSAFVDEYSGLDTSASPLDVSSSNGTATTSTAESSPNVTPTADNELITRVYGDNLGSAWTTAPLGTVRGNDMADGTNGSCWYAEASSSNGVAVVHSGTLATATGWGAMTLVYKLAGVASVDPTFVDHPRSMGRGPLAFTRRQRAYYSPGRQVYGFGSSVQNLFASATDTLTAIAESAAENVSLPRAISDTETALSETLARILSLPRAIADSLTALSDSAVKSAQSFARSTTDNLTGITDSAARTLQLLRSPTDTLQALSDSVARTLTFARSVSDTLTGLTDSAVKSAQAFGRAVTDTLTSISESATKSAQHFNRSVSDTLTAISESASGIKIIIRNLSDNLTAVSDSVSRGALAFLRSPSDTLTTLSESISRTVNLGRAVADTQQALSDAAARVTSVARAATDSLAAIAESATRSLSLGRAAADTATPISESAGRAAQQFLRNATDTLAALIDSVAAIVTGHPVFFNRGSLASRSGIGTAHGRSGLGTAHSRAGIGTIHGRSGIGTAKSRSGIGTLRGR